MFMENGKVTISVAAYKMIIKHLSVQRYIDVAHIIAKLAEDNAKVPEAELVSEDSQETQPDENTEDRKVHST